MSLIAQRKQAKVVGKFYNAFLDDITGGIMPEDFILLGSESGIGKTEMAYNIAFKNAKAGLNVHLFALEADTDEPYYRMMYRLIADMYYADKDRVHIEMNYRNYMQNLINVDKYEPTAQKILGDDYFRLQIHHKESEFTLATLMHEVELAAARSECDMIVLDHIDYFDLNPQFNENMQVSHIMKVLRSINLNSRIPIVAVSHLRKKSSRDQILPTVYDFMGTSDKYKQAKTVILMAPDYEGWSDELLCKGLYPTFICAPKLRVGGGGNYVGRIVFNRHTLEYDGSYEVCKVNTFGTKIEPVAEGSLPYWANRTHLNINHVDETKGLSFGAPVKQAAHFGIFDAKD